MVFTCEKCKKIFERSNHYDRHMKRKTPCYIDLQCKRCGKEFLKLCNLKQHNARKNKCCNIYAIKKLELKIEEEKTKQERERTKQSKPIYQNIINIESLNINNISNFNIICMTRDETLRFIKEDDVIGTLHNYLKFQYNNPDFPENKCIAINNGKIISKENDMILDFNKIKSRILSNVKMQTDDTINKFEKLDDDDIINYGVTQRDYIDNNKINLVKKVHPYICNKKNNGILKKQIVQAVE
jgi:hypothetical protein